VIDFAEFMHQPDIKPSIFVKKICNFHLEKFYLASPDWRSEATLNPELQQVRQKLFKQTIEMPVFATIPLIV